RLEYRLFDGNAWPTTATVVDDAASVRATSIAIDPWDRPHIAYRDEGQGGALKYAYYDGARWQISTVDAFDDTGHHPRIAVDRWGRKHLVYSTITATSAVRMDYRALP
ncbi:MAG: hypothetical protein ACNA8W_10545, partial [Bradymonadaceae bacterium]